MSQLIGSGNGQIIYTTVQNPTTWTTIGGPVSKNRNFTLSFEETENGFVLNTTETKYNPEYGHSSQSGKKFVYNDTNELVKAVSDIIRNKQN